MKIFAQRPLARLALFLLLVLAALASGAEFWIGSRPLAVVYEGRFYAPLASPVLSGQTFGQAHSWEADYRALAADWQRSGSPNRIWLPLIAWGPYETDLGPERGPLAAPDHRHVLGTDQAGRDVFARLVYGFRLAFFFACGLTLGTYGLALGVALVSATSPRWCDTLIQRAIEVWSHLPFLYIVIGAAVLIRADSFYLLLIMILFSWSGLSGYLRAALLREKNSDFYLAAKLLGLPTWRLWSAHLLPQIAPLLLTFLPYTFAGAITSLTVLDYLGFGLPAPLPSWGELLEEGLRQPAAPWLVWPVVLGLISILTLTTLIGEASRKALQPKITREFR